MTGFLSSLVEITLTMSAVIALLLVLTPLLAKRFSPRWRYWVWLVAAVRLAVPFNLSLPDAPVVLDTPPAMESEPYDWSYQQAREQAMKDCAPDTGLGSSGTALHLGNKRALWSYYTFDYTDKNGSEVVLKDTPFVREVTRDDSTTVTYRWNAILLTLWAAGAGLTLTVTLAHHISFLRLVKRWRKPAPPTARAELERQRTRLHITRPVALYACAAVDTPLLTGLFRPAILLPLGLDEAVLPTALAHELTHCRRHDLWYKLLLLAARTVHWFNPLVWLMCRRAEGDVEQCCDYDLLRCAGPSERQAYGQAILTQITSARQPSCHLTTSFSGSKKEVFRRFRALLDGSAKKRGRAALALVLALTLLGGSLVACGEEAGHETEFSSGHTGLADDSGVVTAYLKWVENNYVTFDPVRTEGNPIGSIYNDAEESIICPTAEGVLVNGKSLDELLMERMLSSRYHPIPLTLHLTLEKGRIVAAELVDTEQVVAYPYSASFLVRLNPGTVIGDTLLPTSDFTRLSPLIMPFFGEKGALPLSSECIFSLSALRAHPIAGQKQPSWEQVSREEFNARCRSAEGGFLCIVTLENDVVTAIGEYVGAGAFIAAPTDENAPANYDPAAFRHFLPEHTPFQFSHSILGSQTHLYFCTVENAPGAFVVYHHAYGGGSIGVMNVSLPKDLAYDSVRPVYAGDGGGSGECEFILELTRKGEVFYISFDNFQSRSNPLEFQYRGMVSGKRIAQLKAEFDA